MVNFIHNTLVYGRDLEENVQFLTKTLWSLNEPNDLVNKNKYIYRINKIAILSHEL